MKIKWFGKNCFQILISGEGKEKISIVTDPFGLRFKKTKIDILLLSKMEKNFEIEGNPFLIEGPGEYEIKKVFIQGIEAKPPKYIYTIEAEDLRILYLGNFGQNELSSNQLEMIGPIDVLIVPLKFKGGKEKVGPKEVLKIVSQVEPSVFIPLFSNEKEDFELFLKEVGVKSSEKRKEISIKKEDLKKEGFEIFFLSVQKPK